MTERDDGEMTLGYSLSLSGGEEDDNLSLFGSEISFASDGGDTSMDSQFDSSLQLFPEDEVTVPQSKTESVFSAFNSNDAGLPGENICQQNMAFSPQEIADLFNVFETDRKGDAFRQIPTSAAVTEITSNKVRGWPNFPVFPAKEKSILWKENARP
jgi:hypothetical protein